MTQRGEVLNVRGESIPLYRLQRVFGLPAPKVPAESPIAVIVRNSKGKSYSVMVDDILGTQPVVIKRLGDEIAGMKGITGSAILADGAPALILDLEELVSIESERRAS